MKVNKSRLKETIHIKLSQILIKESSNPLFVGVTISHVELSPDSTSAKVFFSSFLAKGKEKDICKALNGSSGYFQYRLSRSLKSRITPKLFFIYDGGFDHAEVIDRILKQT